MVLRSGLLELRDQRRILLGVAIALPIGGGCRLRDVILVVFIVLVNLRRANPDLLDPTTWCASCSFDGSSPSTTLTRGGLGSTLLSRAPWPGTRHSVLNDGLFVVTS